MFVTPTDEIIHRLAMKQQLITNFSSMNPEQQQQLLTVAREAVPYTGAIKPKANP